MHTLIIKLATAVPESWRSWSWMIIIADSAYKLSNLICQGTGAMEDANALPKPVSSTHSQQSISSFDILKDAS